VPGILAAMPGLWEETKSEELMMGAVLVTMVRLVQVRESEGRGRESARARVFVSEELMTDAVLVSMHTHTRKLCR